MPRYAEFGQNTFVGSPAQAQAHVSSPTAGGLFSVFAWFDFDEGGGAVFELRLSVLGGIRDVLRRGPSLMAVAGDGPALLEWRQAHSGREGVRFARCSLLDAVMLVCETVALLDEEEQKAMEVKPWFEGYRSFLLSVHCYMVKNPDARYFNDSGHLGLWNPQPPQGQDPRLTSSDLASLAVQSPYILMLPRSNAKTGSHSSRNTPAGDELPELPLLLRVALYSAWWRELRGADGDKQKSHQNRVLSFTLSRAGGDAGIAHTARQQLFDAIVRSNRSKFTPELRDYVARTGDQGFFKNWTSTEMKTMALSNSTVDKSLMPLWMQSLIDRDSIARKKMFTPRNASPGSTASATAPMGTPRRLRVSCADATAANSGASTPRGPDRFPWKYVDETEVRESPRDVNFVLGRHFPKRNRTLVPARDLIAHVEFTGWSYPEFEATSRGKYSFDQLRDFDAAGLPRLGHGRSVVSSQPGVFARSFHRLDKRDFQSSLDNFQAEIFHRDSIATTQQLYLRPEVRGAPAPVHYMTAIRTAVSKQL